MTVDLDGAARDDGQSGEHDTVGADVEDIAGGDGGAEATVGDECQPGPADTVVNCER